MQWNSPPIRALVRAALREDATRQDITTQTVIPPNLRVTARIVAKQQGVICGLPLAKAIFRAGDPRCHFGARVVDGDFVNSGKTLAVIRSKARVLLSVERPALNALQHLSGIATFTHEQVQRLKPSKTLLYDTRKTLPGWRLLQKYAVRCGGGSNHRLSLAHFVLIKDNHLKIARLSGMKWIDALRRLRRQQPTRPIEMEIQTPRDLQEALELAPEWVMLDNLPTGRMRAMIRRLRASLPGVHIEISGGVRPDQFPHLKRLGVERISMGRLTHSAPAFDCSLEIDHVDHAR